MRSCKVSQNVSLLRPPYDEHQFKKNFIAKCKSFIERRLASVRRSLHQLSPAGVYCLSPQLSTFRARQTLCGHAMIKQSVGRTAACCCLLQRLRDVLHAVTIIVGSSRHWDPRTQRCPFSSSLPLILSTVPCGRLSWRWIRLRFDAMIQPQFARDSNDQSTTYDEKQTWPFYGSRQMAVELLSNGRRIADE